jgi:type I restriction enzyme S subunit
LNSETIQNYIKTIAVQSAQANLTLAHVRNFIIAWPESEEQNKICQILKRIDSLIQQTDSIIRKTQELKKGLMQELLTKGIGHTEFMDTEHGKIPKTWKIQLVSDICEKPEYGFTQSATDEAIGPKFLRITDIQEGKVKWDDVPYCDCPNELVKKYKLKKGDILFARTGATTGKSYTIGECPKAVFASYLIRIRTKDDVIPEYLFYFFNSIYYWEQIRKKMGGSAQGGINASLLSKIKVHFPSKDEQRKIISILAHVDEQIDREKMTKEKIESLKKGLMQTLLTGQVRIKVN